jgi:Spy/CpxP family protein refolding chaperone
LKQAHKKRSKIKTTEEQEMKQNLLTLLAAVGIIGGGFAVASAESDGASGPGGWHHHGFVLDRFSETLNLTPEQKAKVQPIFDQARPQIVAIHQEAMQKTKAIIDNAMTQIRPMLTPDQQKKVDELKQAHENLRNAMKQLHDAQGQ